MKHNIDFYFIQNLEGGLSCKGYVPDPEHSKSGVTIGIGVDLGQRNEDGLKMLNLSDRLFNQLKPYLGFKKQDAVKFLKANPLEISEDDAWIISLAVKQELADRLIKNFNLVAKFPFQALHPSLQTVIASVFYQYGDLKSGCPNFWRQATEGDIEGLYKNLLNFGDRYTTRRKTEAEYLNKDIAIEV